MRDYLLKKLKNKLLWVFLALLAVNLLYLCRAPLVISDPYIIDQTGKRSPITLPLIQTMPAGAEFTITGRINYNFWLNYTYAWIIPDDGILAITINRQEVALSKIEQAALFDYTNGFHYNFAEYLRPGVNQIELRIRNNGGPSGLAFNPSVQDWRCITGCLSLFLLLLALINILLLDTAINKELVLIWAGGFLIRVLYFLITPFTIRSHDVGGHLHYIDYLLQNRAIPAIHEGWQTYQPPLYYILAACCYKLLNLVGITQSNQVWRGIQFLSLLIYSGFLAVVWQIVKFALAAAPPIIKPDNCGSSGELSPSEAKGLDDATAKWVFALITFWPSGIIHALRIGNDVLFYLFYGLGLLYLLKWQDDHTKNSVYTSFLFITLAFVTKANALVLYAVFGIVYLIKFFQTTAKRKYLGVTAVLVVLFGLGFGVTFGRMVEQKLNGSKNHFIVANASQLQGVEVGNTPRNYLSFDLVSFITEPYVNPFADQGGRQYFWNYLLKTCLVGEFTFPAPVHRVLTLALSIVFLLMLLYLLATLILFGGYFQNQLVLALNGLALLIAAIAFRVSIPAACSNDFRYILPVLISFGCFYGLGVRCWRQEKRLWVARLGSGLAMVLIMVSIGFFIALAYNQT